MVVQTPQILIIVWICVECGYVLAKHGQPKAGKYDATATIFAYVLLYFVLACGGFFGELSL